MAYSADRPEARPAFDTGRHVKVATLPQLLRSPGRITHAISCAPRKDGLAGRGIRQSACNRGGLKWFRDTFASVERPSAGADIYEALNRELPEEPTRLLVLPHFEAPLCPRYIPDSAGVILGLRTSTMRGEILKAIMEGETLYFADSIQALRRIGIDVTRFAATGGGARSDAWLQIKADILGIPFVRPRIPEGAVLGAAMLAGLATGVFNSASEAAERFVREERTFEPNAGRHARYREKLALYRELFSSVHRILKRLYLVSAAKLARGGKMTAGGTGRLLVRGKQKPEPQRPLRPPSVYALRSLRSSWFKIERNILIREGIESSGRPACSDGGSTKGRWTGRPVRSSDRRIRTKILHDQVSARMDETRQIVSNPELRFRSRKTAAPI